MATTSIIPDFRAALQSALSSALPAVQVTSGLPMASVKQREAVYLGDVDGTHFLPVFKGGRKVREEDLQFEVVVEVLKARGTLAEAETRAFELLEAVENTLANDPTISALDGLVHAIPNGGMTVALDWVNEGPACVIRFEIQVVSRLS